MKIHLHTQIHIQSFAPTGLEPKSFSALQLHMQIQIHADTNKRLCTYKSRSQELSCSTLLHLQHDARVQAGTNTDTNSDTNKDTNTNSDTNRNTDTNAKQNTNTNSGTNTDTFCNSQF